MDSDRITGKAKETLGKAEAAIGSVTGDHETEASGRVRQAAGAAQDVYGQAKETLKDNFGDTFAEATQSAEKVLHSAREAVKPVKDTLEREVITRPLIALLIAALVGFVLAQLTTN